MTVAQLDTLIASAYASLAEVTANPAAQLSSGGRSVTYRDPADIQKYINSLEAQRARLIAGSGSVLAIRFGAPE